MCKDIDCVAQNVCKQIYVIDVRTVRSMCNSLAEMMIEIIFSNVSKEFTINTLCTILHQEKWMPFAFTVKTIFFNSIYICKIILYIHGG